MNCKCKWFLYDYRTIAPKEHFDIEDPFWRIPLQALSTIKYCPCCGKQIKIMID